MGSVGSSLVLFARLSGLIIAVLVLYWTLSFKSSFYSSHSSNQELTYSALHPLLMVIGYILVSGEGILIHSWFPGSRKTKKTVHLWLQGVALVSGLIGIWTKFHSQRGFFPNFYSLHSWIGLLSVSLFTAQWVTGFLSFWHKGEVRTTRTKVLPWHIFLGLYTYGLAIAAAETGLLEKLTLLQVKRNVPKRCPESMLVNGVGLALALLSGIVITIAVLPKFQTHSGNGKLVYSSQDHQKCLSS